jgi:hypothetical protein
VSDATTTPPVPEESSQLRTSGDLPVMTRDIGAAMAVLARTLQREHSSEPATLQAVTTAAVLAVPPPARDACPKERFRHGRCSRSASGAASPAVCERTGSVGSVEAAVEICLRIGAAGPQSQRNLRFAPHGSGRAGSPSSRPDRRSPIRE